MTTNEILDSMRRAVISSSSAEAETAAGNWLQIEGADPLQAVNEGLSPAMDEVGRLYERGEYFLPELVGSAEAMKAALAALRPAIVSGSSKLERGVVVMATVEGDIHEIGKTIVSTLLEARGYLVYDLGPDVKIDRLREKITEVNPDVVGLSALLTTTMVNQRRSLETIRAMDSRVKVMVGGAPVSRQWAAQIGADGYGKDAFEAAALVDSLMKG